MRTTTLTDDLLSITMGTTGIMLNLKEVIKKDYTVDELDDIRREKYIKKIKEEIIRLEKFALQFEDKVFSNWVKRFVEFLKKDLKEQMHFEKISDNLRDHLYQEVSVNTVRLQKENNELDKNFMIKTLGEFDDQLD